jgi:hypothetical protein
MRLFSITLCVLFLCTCTTTREPANPSGTAIKSRMEIQAKVMAKIFSGRENPTWSLTEEELRAFNAILDELPATDPVTFNDGLGYRGFVVTLTDTGSRETYTVTVYQGKVRQSRRGGDRHLDDQGYRMERMLLESSKSHLEEQTYVALKTEIESTTLKK